MTKVVGVILAGGLSTRMGSEDKSLLSFGKTTLLGHALNRLQDQVEDVAINANSDNEAYQFADVPVLPDCFTGFAGPLAGVLTGMAWGQSMGATHVITVAADTPFFPENYVAQMSVELAKGQGRLAIAETQDSGSNYFNHPTFGLWPVVLKDDLRGAMDDGVRKVMQWAKPHGVTKVKFSSSPFDPFFNVNRPEDYTQAKALLTQVMS